MNNFHFFFLDYVFYFLRFDEFFVLVRTFWQPLQDIFCHKYSEAFSFPCSVDSCDEHDSVFFYESATLLNKEFDIFHVLYDFHIEYDIEFFIFDIFHKYILIFYF